MTEDKNKLSKFIWSLIEILMGIFISHTSYIRWINLIMSTLAIGIFYTRCKPLHALRISPTNGLSLTFLLWFGLQPRSLTLPPHYTFIALYLWKYIVHSFTFQLQLRAYSLQPCFSIYGLACGLALTSSLLKQTS